MIEWLKKLLWDESVFERIARMAVNLIGQLMIVGTIPGGKELGALLAAGSLFVAAGEKNPKKETPHA